MRAFCWHGRQGELRGGQVLRRGGKTPKPPGNKGKSFTFDKHWLRGALGMRRCLDVTLGTAFSRFRSPHSAQFAFMPHRDPDVLHICSICLAHIFRQMDQMCKTPGPLSPTLSLTPHPLTSAICTPIHGNYDDNPGVLHICLNMCAEADRTDV